MSHLRARLTYANVVATLALFVALGGSATAAALINGKNIKSGTVTGRQIRNHSLTTADFRGHLRGAKGATGATGPAGRTGPAGPRGAAGPKGDRGMGVGGSCPSGSAIRAVAADGAVSCQPDTNTTYTAGGPLTLTGTSFSLPPASDSTDGYLSAGDHARLAAPHSYATSWKRDAFNVGQFGLDVTLGSFQVPTAALGTTVFHVSGEFSGGSTATPITLVSTIQIDGLIYASRRATNTVGTSAFALDAGVELSPAPHTITIGFSESGGTVSVTALQVTAVATE